jgi:BirA family biotin operon repressor/biotin-[acetyl-CoA-carboxylase] ligase
MTNRDAVLSALRASGDACTSGEELAGELGVSRATVGKHVSALRRLGYEVQATPGIGYRLLSAPDLPLPSEVRPLLASSLWGELHGGLSTGSTNDDARKAAASGAPEGSVFLASRQTTGRGRLGRTWTSPNGGVYLSAVLRPSATPVEIASLSLAVALGVALGLEQLGVSPGLKWPNDVVLDGGKLAGLLLEMSAESDAIEWVVAGVGVNVRRSDLDQAHPNAAFLEDVVGSVGLAQVAAVELNGIAEAYERWRQTGFVELRAEYEKRLVLIGRDVRVSGASGGACVEGTVRGIDEHGRLLVRDADGSTARVVAGEVTLRR